MALELVLRLISGFAMAWLWRQGGKSDKRFRRYGSAILSLIITHNFGVALFVHAASIMPVTLIGDNLKNHYQLYWWIPIFCLIHSIPILIASNWIVSVSVAAIQCLMILGSNLIDFPKWNWYEKSYGFILGASL